MARNRATGFAFDGKLGGTHIGGRQIQFADHGGIARIGAAAARRRVVIDQNDAFRIEHRDFGAAHAQRGERFVDVGGDVLDQRQRREIDPYGDGRTRIVLQRGREGDRPTVTARRARDDGIRRRLLDDRPGESVGALQELAAQRLAQPRRVGEGDVVDRLRRHRLAGGILRIDRQDAALRIDQQHQVVDAVSGHVAVHRGHQARFLAGAAPLRMVVEHAVQQEGLHVAVAFEQIAIDDVAERHGRVLQAIERRALQIVAIDLKQDADDRDRKHAEDQQKCDELGANSVEDPEHFCPFSWQTVAEERRPMRTVRQQP